MTIQGVESIGFIGSGRAASFMLEGFTQANLEAIFILADKDPAASARLASRFPFARDAGSGVSAACSSNVLFLAVPPQQTIAVFKDISRLLKPVSMVVSLAPKVTLSELSEFHPDGPVARFLPSAPSALGFGYNPVCYAPNIETRTRNAVQELLRCLGDAPEVAEAELEAYAILTAMGPTYLWPILTTLKQLGAEFGLDAVAARHAVASMAEGAARLFGDVRKSEDTIADMIPSRPLAQDMPGFLEILRERLRILYDKLRP